jgi:hypothetical protein
MANPFFDAAYYLAKNPDVAAAGYTPATAETHYLKYGAAESLTAAARAPNAWFDAKAYLAAYPDLASHGITAANALNHYIAHGLDENRSPAPNVKPADFTYAHYAASNPDLHAAFGIGDPSHMTAQQQHRLLAHFLSYGLHEGRGGVDSSAASSFFAPAAAPAPPVAPPVAPPELPPVTPGQPIVIDPSGSYAGTGGDDLFTANKANLDQSILDGKCGNDTLQLTMDGASGSTTVALTSIENIAAALAGANTLINTGGPGVAALSVSGEPGSSLAYQGDKVASVTLAGNLLVNAAFTPATVEGAGDSLHLGLDSGVQGALLTSHIENFDIAFGTGAGASQLSLTTGPLDANALCAVLSGGHAGDAMNFIFTTDPAAALQTVTVDGTAAVGNLAVTLNALGAANAVLTGGAGDDILNASAGIDTLTGGHGNDIFAYGDSPAALVRIDRASLETDRITDLSEGDQITFAGLAPTLVDPLIANAIAGVNHGVVTFKAGFLSGLNDLTGIVEAIDGDMMLAGPGEGTNLLFNDGAASYFLHTGAGLADSSLIKLELMGVAADIGQLTADARGVHYTPAPI